MTKVIRVDTRGRFRLPSQLKEAAGIRAHDELLVTCTDGRITIKRIEQEALSDRFEALAKKTREKFAANGVTAEGLSAGVRWARKG